MTSGKGRDAPVSDGGTDRTAEAADPDLLTRELFSQSVASPGALRILMAAVDCFRSTGFSAARTREIAFAAGLSPAAVYIHFHSKDQLLEIIVRSVLNHVLRETSAEAARHSDPTERLWHVIRISVALPARLHKAASVVNTEFIHLGPDQFAEVMQGRDALDRIIGDCLLEGHAAGQIVVNDLSLTRTAITALCRSVLTWYSPDGRFRPDELGAKYADMVLKLVSPSDR